MPGEYELLLDPKENRLVPIPVRYNDLFGFYEQLSATEWSVGHFKDAINKDPEQFETLDPKEQNLVKCVLVFFAASDGLVNMNLLDRFIKEVQITEARDFYIAQARQEVVHARTYGRLIEAYIKDEEERDATFNALEHVPAIQAKGNWAKKWIDSDKSFAHRLLAFAIVEGIYFCGSFCVIFWFMSKNVLPGLTSSNEWISRDESLHTAFAIWLYNNYIRNKLSQEEIQQMVREAVDIEQSFIQYALPEGLLGMNESLMTQYIQYVADGLLLDLKCDPIYNVTQPFEFMKKQNLSDVRGNFFEVIITTYNRFGEGVDMSQFNMDAVCDKFNIAKSEAYQRTLSKNH
jgi:ribonucleoside-diphosphate reductase beta chain